MNLKPTTYWFDARSLNRVFSMFVALSTVTSSASLVAKDYENNDKTRDRQNSVQNQEQGLAEGQSEDMKAKTDPEKFIRHVAEFGMQEIRLAKLVNQRAEREEVKQFAEKLVQDHTSANNELRIIAQHQNIPWDMAAENTPPASARGAATVDTSRSAATLIEKEPVRTREGTPVAAGETARGAYAVNDASSQDRRDSYDSLQALTGKSFEDAYLKHEVESHTRAVAKFEKANRDLPDGELRQFVQSTLPTLRNHLAMAKRMAPADAARLNIHERTDSDYKTKRASSSTQEEQEIVNK